MKLHDLSPAPGSRRPRTRVGRGIAGGKGKTAGRGTKGQKSRTGGSIPPWFEGGQTPIHIRVPKLRGFRNLLRVEYEIVNVGHLSDLAESGILDMPEIEGAPKSAKPAPVTITPDILAMVGLVRNLTRPLKILGSGEVTRPLFVVADAFTKSAAAKIEAAGGTAQVIEFPAASEGKAEEAAVAEAPAPAEASAKPAKADKADAPAKPARKSASKSPAADAGSEA
jgi:large subunit ribosomal protein L15